MTRKSCGDKGIDFDTLPQNVKAVLVDLHYNMPNNINEFTKFWAAIKDKNWQEAGRQLVDNGSGNPSGYLNQVAGRAYANAMILTTGDTTGFRRFKEEGGTDRQGLFDKFNASVGEYGKKVGMGERKDILENAENAADILSQTTSVDVLKTQGSTKSVIKILDKYLQENPEKRGEMIQALRAQIGDFSRPLQTPEEVGAFQQLFYLAYPDRFANEVGYIDGDYGPKTKETFMRDIFVMGGWQEKMEGSNGILNKSPAEIATYISGLSEFEKEILKKHYTSGNVNENSSKDEIIKAQLGLALSGVDIPVDGVWNEKTRELLEYPEVAKSLGDFVQNNYETYGGGAFSCGASVGRMLNGFGVQGLPGSDRDGKNWNEFLDARPDQFIKVRINTPDEARPGGILCYDGGGGGSRSDKAIKHGHVEVKGSDGGYYYYKRGRTWGGSAGPNLENSKFTGYVYYPRRLEA